MCLWLSGIRQGFSKTEATTEQINTIGSIYREGVFSFPFIVLDNGQWSTIELYSCKRCHTIKAKYSNHGETEPQDLSSISLFHPVTQ